MTTAVRPVLPRDASLDGHLVDGTVGYLTLTTGIAFAAVVVVLLIAVTVYRERDGRTRAAHTHGDRLRDQWLVLAGALALFVVVDVTLAVRSTRDLEARFWRYPDRDPRALRIEVTARQWAWTFRTAGPDGRFGTLDDVVTLGELDVPVGRPLYFKLRSKDVIHSFYLPAFRTKIDVIPGSTTRLWTQATTPGRYEIGCAQHCGVGHYKMRAVLIARTEADYDTWRARAEVDSRMRAATIAAATPPDDAWPWEPAP